MRSYITISLFASLFAFTPLFTGAATLSGVAGRILLQVESHGEAWYVSPDNSSRFYLGRPDDAFSLMKDKGVGISNKDLSRIAPAVDALSGPDADGDKLPDDFERAVGTNPGVADTDGDAFSDFDEFASGHNPKSDGLLPFDSAFSKAQKGRIFLQVESKGEAWYVYPPTAKRYFLGRPVDAFAIMRKLGLGITNADLEKIVALTPNYDLAGLEARLFELVNIEREKNGLKKLKTNAEVAAVARRHSRDLAEENKLYTAMDSYCSFPFIHHEGLKFGQYHDDRLAASKVNYHRMSAENIALLGAAAISLTYAEGSVSDAEFKRCEDLQAQWDKSIKTALDDDRKTDAEKKALLEAEIAKRKKEFAAARRLRIGSSKWQSMEDIAQQTVQGWMESPGHRKNILTADYDEAGMGVAYANSYIISTQVFITRTDCGYIGGPCCDRGTYLACYEPNTCSRATGLCVMK